MFLCKIPLSLTPMEARSLLTQEIRSFLPETIILHSLTTLELFNYCPIKFLTLTSPRLTLATALRLTPLITMFLCLKAICLSALASCAQQSDPTTANIANPCALSAQSTNGFSNNASNNAPIALSNNDESLMVAANDFNFSGNIYANGVVDFSKIKGSANIKNLYLYNNAQFQANNLTISNQAVLEKNASFVTNNLNIQGAFNNNATQKIEVLQNLVIASNASLSTGIYGLEVGGL